MSAEIEESALDAYSRCIADVAEQASLSVVAIHTSQKDGHRGSGSGFEFTTDGLRSRDSVSKYPPAGGAPLDETVGLGIRISLGWRRWKL